MSTRLKTLAALFSLVATLLVGVATVSAHAQSSVSQSAVIAQVSRNLAAAPVPASLKHTIQIQQGGKTVSYVTCSRTYTGQMAYSGQQFMAGFYASLGDIVYGKLDSVTHEYCGSAQSVAEVAYGSTESCIQISAYMNSAGGKTTQTTCSQSYVVYVYGPWVSDGYDPLDGVACFYSNCINVQAYY